MTTPVFEQAIETWTGILVHGGYESYWKITCPCGIETTYGLSGLPKTDTPHACGNPLHWTVKYELESSSKMDTHSKFDWCRALGACV